MLKGLLVAAALALAALATILLGRARAEIDRLRRSLKTSSSQLHHLQASFSRFVPAGVVDRIAASGVPSGAGRKEVTVLFADLVDFTTLSEPLEPELVVEILNEYFVRMSQVIGEHRGHVSKFIGDGLMALFGALEPDPWQANDAVYAALGMRAALAAYNEELAARGLPTLRFGVGIHRGPAVAGVIGSHELLEFTVIGHTVNLASRVEHLTRVHEADILITRDVQRTLDRRFVVRELPPCDVHGISGPVVACAVEGLAPAD